MNTYRAFFLLGSILLLVVGLKSNNPLMTAVSVILSLTLVSPVLGTVSPVWYCYLLLILFLGGVFVVVIYFTSMCTYFFKGVTGVWILVFSSILTPFMVFTLAPVGGAGVLFTQGALGFILILIITLTALMLFSSYLLSSNSALRNL